MIVLDTNHLQELLYRSALGVQLEARLAAAEVVTTVVSAEETLRGRLAKVAAARTTAEQTRAYGLLSAQIAFLGRFTLLPWDEDAAARFAHFRSQGVRIGTMDLKITCIALEHDGLLLTRNAVDFDKVAGLRFEDWLG